MPTRLENNALPYLVEILEQYLPEALRVQANVRSFHGGLCDGQTIWVNDWPNVQAVVCVVNTKTAKFPYLGNRLEMFARCSHALEAVLRHPGVVNWNEEYLVAAVTNVCMHAMDNVSRQLGTGHVIPYDTELYIYYLPDTTSLPQIVCPSNLILGSVETRFAKLLSERWEPEGGEAARQYIEGLIEHFPSVAVCDKARHEPVAYCLLYYYSALALLYVDPEHRGKGLGKLITVNIVEKLKNKCSRQIPYLVVDTGNNAAIEMYESLGFKRLEKRLLWFRLTPHKRYS